MAALLGAIGEPRHFAMLAGGQESAQTVAGFRAEMGGGEPYGIEAEGESGGADAGRRAHPRPRYVGTPCSGTQTPGGTAAVCQNTSIGMPPRGYQ